MAPMVVVKIRFDHAWQFLAANVASLPFPVTPSLLSQYDRNTDTSKKRANNASADKSFMAMQSVSDVTSLAFMSVLSFASRLPIALMQLWIQPVSRESYTCG
jgi:hypothetical protein